MYWLLIDNWGMRVIEAEDLLDLHGKLGDDYTAYIRLTDEVIEEIKKIPSDKDEDKDETH